MSPQSNYVRLIVPIIVKCPIVNSAFFQPHFFFSFLMLQFLKELKILALLSTFKMLSLERQNECTFILLPEHDRPDLSAVAAQSTQSNSSERVSNQCGAPRGLGHLPRHGGSNLSGLKKAIVPIVMR